ncbi:MAG: hypothetical protein ABSG81_12770 [Acidimicrobiales bacterium]|jgi:hypothetical protein
MRGLIRRPSPPALATLIVVVACIGVVLWQIDPRLLLSNTDITGGDTGAHFGLAAFLKSNLLPSGHLTGWFPGAYDGLPLNTYYFPLPDALAALMGFVIPFAVAFKLVTILGSLTLPIAAWAFGRLAGLERPRPAVLAVFTLPFLFEQSFTIYGGNLYSTMAGEYAFSLGLSVAIVFLGTVVRGMRTGRMRVPAILLLSACVLCHLVTTLFALVGVVAIVLLFGPNRRNLRWAFTVVGTSFLLVAWWAVPFITEQAYSTTMGWQNVTTYRQLLMPHGDWWALIMAFVGLVLAAVRVERAMLGLTIAGVCAALFVRFAPQQSLYNARLLPIWWIVIYLLAGYAVAELLVMGARVWRYLREALRWEPPPVPAVSLPGGSTPAFATGGPALPMTAFGPRFGASVHAAGDVAGLGAGPRDGAMAAVGTWPGDVDVEGGRASWPSPAPGGPPLPPPRRPTWAPGAVMAPFVALALGALVVLPPLLITPGSTYKLGWVQVQTSNVASWAQWNYSGMQGKPGWPEFKDGIVATMDSVSAKDGCGRAMWEYNSNLNRFGTPMAPMLLPYFTNGCIQSMEGLLFESSSSTPWHFINQAELSVAPSEAMVHATTGIVYGPVDVPLGIQHLQLLGVKYFLASSPVIQQQADADPALTLLATSGPWHTPYEGAIVTTTWDVYEVHDSSMVVPLTERPDVLTGVGAAQGAWLPVAQRWYADPKRWDQQLVADGPSTWTKAPGGVAPSGNVPLPAVTVSDVHTGVDQVSFHVSRTGVPVLVRTSYFPAWHATGAEGPWRAMPNLMVVVPTSHQVTVFYGSTKAGDAGLVLSIAGVLVTAVLVWRRHTYA